jgi:hypothetical protein
MKSDPSLLLRANRVILGLCVVAGLASPAKAEHDPTCDAFKRNSEGDWVAKQNVTVSGPTGPVEITAGRAVDDDIQDRLDDRCRIPRNN